MKIIGLVIATMLSMAVVAGESETGAKTPTQKQLIELLSDNTMQGLWAGRPYIQYFSGSGSTQYRELDGSATSGRWRINRNAQYCSVWPPSDQWACYDVLVNSNNIFWISGDDLYPAEITKGNVF